MSMCSCDMEPATVYREVERKAIREHKCTDCGGVIGKRERYQSMACLFDGHWSTAKRCADCKHMIHEVERAFMEGCGGRWCVYTGDLPLSWDEIVENLSYKPEEREASRRIIAMQHAACDARAGNRKWSLPLWMQKDGE